MWRSLVLLYRDRRSMIFCWMDWLFIVDWAPSSSCVFLIMSIFF